MNKRFSKYLIFCYSVIMENKLTKSLENYLLTIDTILEKKETIFIFAGYKDEMETFMRLNPGLTSRVGYYLEYPDYTIEQLYQIGDEITRFVSDMISSRDPVTGIGIVNPNYPSILEEYFASPTDCSEIYDKINRQLEEWTKQK